MVGALVTGTFFGTATFGPGEAGATPLTDTGNGDLFLARYGADGTLLWAKRAGGAGRVLGSGVAALPDGGALVTGFFGDTAHLRAGGSRPGDPDGRGIRRPVPGAI